MNKKTLVTTGLILTLLGSNITMGMSYKIKNHHNESLIFDQKQKIQKLEKIKELQSELIKIKSSDIEMLRDKTNEYLTNLDQAIKENSTLKDENTKLKKQLAKRKEVNKVFEITAYTAGYESTQKRNGEKGYGITASGTTVKEGRTIACPPSMKFGTKVKIDGVGIRICEDRGGAIKEGHIDMYMESVSAALDFGRQKISITVLKEGKS